MLWQTYASSRAAQHERQEGIKKEEKIISYFPISKGRFYVSPPEWGNFGKSPVKAFGRGILPRFLSDIGYNDFIKEIQRSI